MTRILLLLSLLCLSAFAEVKGIDVSHHQGKIDWRAIYKQEIRFAYIKASEGVKSRDPRFKENVKGAQAAGIKVGAYHYYNLCRDAGMQAQNFIEALKDEKKLLIPAVDLEFVGNCERRPPLEIFRRELQEALQLIENHFGKPPILYTTDEFFLKYLDNTVFQKYALWIRDIPSEPTKVTKTPLLRQIDHRAKLKGIKGFVDLDVLLGSLSDLGG